MRRVIALYTVLLLAAALVNSCTVTTRELRHEADAAEARTLTEIRYSHFTILYDCELGEPHRFMYHLDADHGTLPRRDNFRVDRSLPEGCKRQHSNAAYNQVTGFHRGHLVPVNHLDDSREAMNASNLMTNIVPQRAEHNSRTWGQTEKLTDCYRDIRPVDVIGGVVFGDTSDEAENDYFVESHGIRTPEVFWKILLTSDPDTGEPKIIAWWIPHRDGYGSNLNGLMKPVREIEVLLGPTEPSIDVPEELKDLVPARSWQVPTGCSTG